MTDATLDPTFHTHWLAHKAPDSPTILSAQAVDSFRSIPNELPGAGITVRGIYDVSGFRNDANLMLWLHGGDVHDIQLASRSIRREPLLCRAEATWAVVGAHRPAELNRRHVPAFVKGTPPARWNHCLPLRSELRLVYASR